MKTAIIVFPASNCDRDAKTSVEKLTGKSVHMVWHQETSLPDDLDLVILPGGFSYGDYLRCGAIAARSPIMQEVIKFAKNGGYVLGICNGFQILTESGLLPGALICNRDLKFLSKKVLLRVENNNTNFTNKYKSQQILSIPVAHHEGNYQLDQDQYYKLEDNNQIAFRYCDEDGVINGYNNINGAVGNIAGIFNETKNILGMMPHPERVCEKTTQGEDGVNLFNSLITAFA